MPEPLMPTAVRLAASMDALSALAAYVRVETEGLEVDDEVRAMLTSIGEELLGDSPEIGGAGVPMVGMVQAFLRQAVDLVEHPGRRGAWAESDEGLLQGLGRLSGAVAEAFKAAEDHLDGHGDALAQPGARFLDVGTGTGWLAIATATSYPAAQLVGIDVFEPALNLARKNVAHVGLTDRIELRLEDVTALADENAYDAVWLPLPFLPRTIVEPAVQACTRALKPGGWLLPGTFSGSGDRLSGLLNDLRTVRSGGHPWQADEVHTLLTSAGLTQVQQVPRSWATPLHLYAGRKPV